MLFPCFVNRGKYGCLGVACTGEVLFLERVVEMQGLFEVGVQALCDRAGVCGGLNYAAGFVVVGVLKVDVQDDFADAARFGFSAVMRGSR